MANGVNESRNLGNLTNGICISNPLGDYAIPINTHGATTIVTTVAPIPTPTPDKTNSYCGKYHLFEAGEDCGTLTTKYGVTLEDFFFLNPEVWPNCTNLSAQYYYCMAPVGYISTYPGYDGATTTTTGTDISMPSPILASMASNCDDFYKVVKDDSCYNIAQANKVDLASFCGILLSKPTVQAYKPVHTSVLASLAALQLPPSLLPPWQVL
ncbi:Peptidoglycan-binding Lysin subgroup [Tolypocladium capitatum]|uniref:Peptidoglycan-binding Lysin subgroup n=1 Tax=Tolypocladium capitatum TaxID=45235 RepID=A0A2K3QGR5_9HYPO|nr:Peptidoglycan-binding Lysin subgroup [Tolypocladium capitatum]